MIACVQRRCAEAFFIADEARRWSQQPRVMEVCWLASSFKGWSCFPNVNPASRRVIEKKRIAATNPNFSLPLFLHRHDYEFKLQEKKR